MRSPMVLTAWTARRQPAVIKGHGSIGKPPPMHAASVLIWSDGKPRREPGHNRADELLPRYPARPTTASSALAISADRVRPRCLAYLSVRSSRPPSIVTSTRLAPLPTL